jgi:transcriptional regulator with XRE-family HTH domain
MTYEQKINMAAAYTGISQAELARRVGITPQNFNKKAKRGTFSPDELEKIAEALGAVYRFGFVFPDGKEI